MRKKAWSTYIQEEFCWQIRSHSLSSEFAPLLPLDTLFPEFSPKRQNRVRHKTENSITKIPEQKISLASNSLNPHRNSKFLPNSRSYSFSSQEQIFRKRDVSAKLLNAAPVRSQKRRDLRTTVNPKKHVLAQKGKEKDSPLTKAAVQRRRPEWGAPLRPFPNPNSGLVERLAATRDTEVASSFLSRRRCKLWVLPIPSKSDGPPTALPALPDSTKKSKMVTCQSPPLSL